MQVKHFEDRFYDLRLSALAEVTDKGVSVKEFRTALMTLPQAIQSEHEEFILAKYSLFEKAESVESIFAHLNFYLSFIDFSLLEHIIQKFCSKGLQNRMKCYVQDMVSFRSETTVSEIIPHLRCPSKILSNISRFEVRLDIDITTFTLEDLEDLRTHCASELSLSKFALQLAEIKKSSLVLTWLVPSAIVPFVKRSIQQLIAHLFFVQVNPQMLEIFVDEECLFITTHDQSRSKHTSPIEVLDLHAIFKPLNYFICDCLILEKKITSIKLLVYRN